MEPLVSVIIPVYNVERYLRRCVDSVLNQTYKNLEIILVDDGSPDGSPAICDEYAQIDSRVKVIHKENGGLSSARNAGMAVATGEYIGFVDSDDWIDPVMYQVCYDLIEQNKADMSKVERCISTGEDDKTTSKETPNIDIYTGKEILQYYMTSSTTTGSYAVWRSLYRADILKGLTFREGKINEDIDFNYKAYSRCQKIAVTSQKLYYYFQNIDSISNGGLNRKDFDLCEAADILYDLTSNEAYGTIAFLGKVKKARSAFSLLCKIAYFGISDPTIDKTQLVQELTAEHRKNVGLLLKAPLSLSRKALAVMFSINYKLTENFIHFAQRL